MESKLERLVEIIPSCRLQILKICGNLCNLRMQSPFLG